MAISRDFWTVQDVYDLPDDGNRYETVNGELLVTPGPSLMHQYVTFRLIEALHNYLRAQPVGLLFGGPAEATRSNVTRVQPDVMVVPKGWYDAKAYGAVSELLLVAEVLSPSSRRADRFTKRIEFQREGVPLYWIIDSIEERVEAWTPADERATVISDTLVWSPTSATKPFRLLISELFESP